MDAESDIRPAFTTGRPVPIFAFTFSPRPFLWIAFLDSLMRETIENSELDFANTLFQQNLRRFGELLRDVLRSLHSSHVRRGEDDVEGGAIAEEFAGFNGLLYAQRRKRGVDIPQAAAPDRCVADGLGLFLGHIALRLSVASNHQQVGPFLSLR